MHPYVKCSFFIITVKVSDFPGKRKIISSNSQFEFNLNVYGMFLKSLYVVYVSMIDQLIIRHVEDLCVLYGEWEPYSNMGEVVETLSNIV